MSPKEIHKILLEVFAKGGTIFNGVTLSCVSPASVLITKENEDRIRIDFPENKPVASFKR
jgi:hypothetical protein